MGTARCLIVHSTTHSLYDFPSDDIIAVFYIPFVQAYYKGKPACLLLFNHVQLSIHDLQVNVLCSLVWFCVSCQCETGRTGHLSQMVAGAVDRTGRVRDGIDLSNRTQFA